MSISRNSKIGLCAVALVALVALTLTLRRQPSPETRGGPPVPPTAPTNIAVAPPTVITPPPPAAPGNQVGDKIAAIKDFPDSKTAKQRLAELRQALAAMPKDAAVAALRQYLDSKADAPTHLGFKVSGNGWLDEAPTMRTFLMDELARLDPAAAADYAKIVLGSADSPDEWAVALRSLAVGDSSPEGRTLLSQKESDLLQNASWQQNPSVGYLEAFDVAVYLGGTTLVPTLSTLVRAQDNPAIAHAAFLALDRLVINDPATMLGALETSPDLMQGREATRADYFARADVRDPQQRQVLESYLLNPNLTPSELKTFAGVYPNANFMISQNLLTPTPTPDHSSLTARDTQSLAVAQQWLADPRFAKLQPTLLQITQRLQTFVNQAAQNH